MNIFPTVIYERILEIKNELLGMLFYFFMSLMYVLQTLDIDLIMKLNLNFFFILVYTIQYTYIFHYMNHENKTKCKEEDLSLFVYLCVL